jgi:phosphate transport system substrate-binding protein
MIDAMKPRPSVDYHRFVLPAFLALLAGCGGGQGDDAAPGSKSGTPSTIVVDGSSTVYLISRAAQQEYSTIKEDVTVVVDYHGTGGGFGRYLEGEVDIVDASRDAEPEETAKAKAQGIEWTRFLVGYDGITLVANPKNDFVKSLTVDQLKALWSPDSKIRTWKDLNPAWPDRKIVLYSPDDNSGTFEFFTEAIVKKKKAQRDDVQQNSDDNTLVNGVSGDPDGLGYFGYAYFAANSAKLRAVAVQNGADAKPVLPTHETVLDKSYAPLARPLYIFVKNSAMRRAEVADFLKFYLKNVKKFAEKGGYVAPTETDIAANETLLTGGGAKVSASAPVEAKAATK